MKRYSILVMFLVGLFGTFNANGQQVLEAKKSPQQDSATSKKDESSHQKSATKKDERRKTSDEVSHFLRIRRDDKGKPVAMETSVTRYIGKNEQGKKITVDLIGVVHIGEKGYYEKLNQRFEQYDALLYELVAPKGTVIPKGGRAKSGGVTNPVAAMQLGMKSMLELDFQLDHIDYTKDNFVHADMTPTEFAASMKKNKESLMRMVLTAVGQSMAKSGASGTSDIELFADMMGGTYTRRAAMAKQMQDMENGMVIFEGKNGSTIIDHRNAKAMDILKREIARGNESLALFYGAGHLPDMQRRLESDFRMQRAGQFWLEAWRLKAPKK